MIYKGHRKKKIDRQVSYLFRGHRSFLVFLVKNENFIPTMHGSNSFTGLLLFRLIFLGLIICWELTIVNYTQLHFFYYYLLIANY